jgi:hypothetical protein
LVGTAGIGLTLLLPPRLGAVVIQVPEGVGTMQAAVDAAAPGDTLVLGAGNVYGGALAIAKSNLTIRTRGVLRGRPPIGGFPAFIETGCTAAAALTITGSNVRLLGSVPFPIVVSGGTNTVVSVAGASGIRFDEVEALIGCGEHYGFDVGTSTRVKMRSLESMQVPSTSPAGAFVGIRLHDVAEPVAITNAQMGAPGFGLPAIGLVVEESGLTRRRAGSSGIKIQRSGFNAVSVQDSHALLFDAVTADSIDIDALSSDNEFLRCSSNSVITDGGTADCGKNNIGFTLPPCQ